MNYFITRDGQQYGPYSLGDLQRYVASGEILLTDLALSEGMTEPLPVSLIIGTIPVPPTPAQIAQMPLAPEYPDPPNLHWGLVLLFSVISCGLFIYAWDLVQGAWMRKLEPQSKAVYYYAVATGLALLVFCLSFSASVNHTKNPLVNYINLCVFVVILIGRYSLKASLEEHYNAVEPMGLMLGGIMTFFFGCIYFQYHLNDIVRRKNLDRLSFMSA
jgi:hypothetical protein